jgi:S-adenosylmethionine-diacylglycerol 3-amino-3-carboxypropyl transferase
VREDPRLDARVIDVVARAAARPVRVLMIASGGCTALSLLGAPSVASVDAVDGNPAQLHLVELRRQALIALPLAAQLGLMGADAAWSGEARLAAYEQLRPSLPAPTRSFWDARRTEVAFGPGRAGRFEALFRELARAVDPARPDGPGWRDAFDRVFERGRLARTFGPEAVDYSMDRPFSAHFAAAFAAALGRWRVDENYFLSQIFEERYLDGPDGAPPSLQAETQARIRALGTGRLHLHAHRLDAALAALPGPWDVIHNSNISDWMPVPELEAMLARERALLAPGGAVIGRRLNGDHHLGAVMARQLDVDGALGAELLAADRSFFYREVVVGFRR